MTSWNFAGTPPRALSNRQFRFTVSDLAAEGLAVLDEESKLIHALDK